MRNLRTFPPFLPVGDRLHVDFILLFLRDNLSIAQYSTNIAAEADKAII